MRVGRFFVFIHSVVRGSNKPEAVHAGNGLRGVSREIDDAPRGAGFARHELRQFFWIHFHIRQWTLGYNERGRNLGENRGVR